MNPTLKGALFVDPEADQSAVKMAIFGPQGCGKSTTLALIAIALSKTYHNSAPVLMHDTENGSTFLKPLFEMEGVPLKVRKSRAFKDMCAGIKEAEQIGACCFIEDSITHDWNELLEGFKKRKNITRIAFHHWNELKPLWNNDWVVPMLNSKVHMLIAGRSGNIWEEVTQEDGTTEQHVTGTKLKAEGEMGYEPSLLIEMESERKFAAGRKRGGNFIHRAFVLKDRTRAIQGRTFEWPDLNSYKPGGYKAVFEKIKPHVDFFSIGGPQCAIHAASSEELFDSNGQSEYYRREQQKRIALDEILATMQLLWPGQSAADKQLRIRIMETTFGARAWSAIEAMSLEQVQDGLETLRQYEAHSKQPPSELADLPRSLGLETEAGVLALLNAVKTERMGYQQKGPVAVSGRAQAPTTTPVSAPIITSNGDGTLHIAKTPLNLPPIPPEQSLGIREDDLEIVYAPTANSTIHLVGEGTLPIRKSLKQLCQARGGKNEDGYFWDMPAAHFGSLEALCQKSGIRLIAAGA